MGINQLELIITKAAEQFDFENIGLYKSVSKYKEAKERYINSKVDFYFACKRWYLNHRLD